MGIFGTAHGLGGGQKGPPSLKSVTHIQQWRNISASFAKSRNTDIDYILIHNF